MIAATKLTPNFPWLTYIQFITLEQGLPKIVSEFKNFHKNTLSTRRRS